MLTLKDTLEAADQMLAFGEDGTDGAQGEPPARIRGPKATRTVKSVIRIGDETEEFVRRWDNKLKLYVPVR